MRIALMGLLLLMIAGTTWAETKALLVVIDQKRLGNAEQALNHIGLDNFKASMQPLTDSRLGTFSEVFKEFLPRVTAVGDLIPAWDDARGAWIEKNARGVYDDVIVVKGVDYRDNAKMKEAWSRAMASDVIDYVLMVHGESFRINPEWNVDVNTKKIRMVFNEGCSCGSGKDYFVKGFHALASAGFNAEATHPAASPFYTFIFLKSWFAGVNFQRSLATAYTQGSLTITPAFKLAQMLGGYKTPEEAIESSRISFAWDQVISPEDFNVNSSNTVERSGEISESFTK